MRNKVLIEEVINTSCHTRVRIYSTLCRLIAS